MSSSSSQTELNNLLLTPTSTSSSKHTSPRTTNECEITIRSEHDSSSPSSTSSSAEERDQTPTAATVSARNNSSQDSSERYDEDASIELIYLLNSQEKAILFQLCAHQLNRLVDLTPDALKALITYQPATSASSKQFRSPAVCSPSSNWSGKSSVSLADKAKSALFTWGGKSQNCESDVTVLDISIVKILSDHLLQNLDFEGLFRVPGNLLRVDKLKEGIRTGELSNLLATGYFTQHDIASVLKYYLSGIDLIPGTTHLTHLLIANLTHALDHERSIVKEKSRKLATSLEEVNTKFHVTSSQDDVIRRVASSSQDDVIDRLTSSHYDVILGNNASSLQNMDQLLGSFETLSLFEKKKKQHIEALQIVFCMLSANQRAIMKIVLSMLYQVAKNKSITRMSASNLATIFAPHFFASNPTPASMAAQSKTSSTSGASNNLFNSASVNLNVTCVENWTLTCYAVTFMIRHWRLVLQVPSNLREQVSNYLYARQNAAQILGHGSRAVNNESEKRGRLRNFLKSGGGSTSSSRKNSSGVDPQESESENKSKQRGNSCSRSNTPNSKQRSKSAHTGIATAFKGRLPGVNILDKKESYDVRKQHERNKRYLSPPPAGPRTPLKVSPIQNSTPYHGYRNTPV